MAENNVIRQDIVQVLFETSGVEELLNSETALSDLNGILGQLANGSEHFEKSNQKTTHSMMEMAAQSELLGKLADTGKEVIDTLLGCVDASSQFETSLAKLATIADTSSVSLGVLTDDLLDLSNDTGVAVTSLTESAYQAISASVDTAGAVDFVAQANELAIGGFTSTETAVDVLSTAINAYGLEVEQAGQLSDYLITTQNLGKTSVDQLAQSVGKVIPLASAYNVEMDNLSSAYAVMTANGIATAETGTYLKSMLTELADTGSVVAGVLQDETGMSFSELSASGKSLGDILAIIGTSVDNDATAFSNLWSSSEAGVGALSLLNAGTEKYNSVLNEMQHSAGAASQAYETMTNTAAHAQEELINKAENLKIAVGNSLLDTFADLNIAGADALGWLTEFVKEHEALVAGMTTGVAVAAVLTVGVTGLGAAFTMLTAAAAAFNTTTGGILLAIGAAAAVIGTAVAAIASIDDTVEDYDGTLEECRNEIELTETSLKKAKDAYGEDSDVVRDLESDLETLNKQYAKGGGYLGELQQKIDDASDAFREMDEAQQETLDGFDRSETSGLRAVTMLQSLSEKANLTTADLDLMSSYANYLNDTFHCDIQVNYDTGELTGFDPQDAVNKVVELANQNRAEFATGEITNADFVNDYLSAVEAYQEAKKAAYKAHLDYAQEESRSTFTEYTNDLWNTYENMQEKADKVSSVLDDYNDKLYEFGEMAGMTKEEVDLYIESLQNTDVAVGDLQNSVEETTDALSWHEQGADAAQDAISSMSDELYVLCEAYDEAYQSALDSIEGQYSIWDEVEDVQSTSTDSIIAALDSQNAYWIEYNDNLAGLQERAAGIDGLGDMLASMADGSEDSAAALAGLADASDAELATAVEAWQNLKQNQDDTASNMASVQTQFESALSNIRDDMNDLVTGMDKESEAYAAATGTMDGFIRGIYDKMADAQTALNSLTLTASQVANVNITAPVEANATGTTNSSDVFIAGEQGAELIVGMGGSTVFPASETEKIINAVSDYADFSRDYTPYNTVSSNYSSRTVSYAPVFHLTQYGGASGVNQRQVKRWMQQAIDDSFASISRTNPSVYEI